jgi:hypothetical protein
MLIKIHAFSVIRTLDPNVLAPQDRSFSFCVYFLHVYPFLLLFAIFYSISLGFFRDRISFAEYASFQNKAQKFFSLLFFCDILNLSPF